MTTLTEAEDTAREPGVYPEAYCDNCGAMREISLQQIGGLLRGLCTVCGNQLGSSAKPAARSPRIRTKAEAREPMSLEEATEILDHARYCYALYEEGHYAEEFDAALAVMLEAKYEEGHADGVDLERSVLG